jgi:hypothetical protein
MTKASQIIHRLLEDEDDDAIDQADLVPDVAAKVEFEVAGERRSDNSRSCMMCGMQNIGWTILGATQFFNGTFIMEFKEGVTDCGDLKFMTDALMRVAKTDLEYVISKSTTGPVHATLKMFQDQSFEVTLKLRV